MPQEQVSLKTIFDNLRDWEFYIKSERELSRALLEMNEGDDQIHFDLVLRSLVEPSTPDKVDNYGQ